MRRTVRWALAACAATGMQVSLNAEEAAPAPEGEEIVVTGSYIRGTPEDAALPVDVINMDEVTPPRSI